MADVTQLTADMATAYLASNKVQIDQVEGVIRSIHGALVQAEAGGSVEAELEVERPTAAQIRKSIAGDKLISFEDGRAYSSLTRHLSARGMTMADYRAKWGLAADYPQVAPGYSAKRSALAMALGLGRKPGVKQKAKG